MDIKSAEESPVLERIAPLCDHMLSLIQEAVAAAKEAIAHYGGDEEAHDSAGSLRYIAAVDASPASLDLLQAIDAVASARDPGLDLLLDLAHISVWTIRRKRALVEEAAAAADPWRMIGACSSARRMVIKAATEIERAAAAVEGVPSQLAYLHTTEVERSLGVRALYHRLRSDIRPDSSPDPAAIEPALRAMAVCFAKVIGDRRYDDLRVQDRQLFRSLQQQLVRWMSERRQSGPEATALTGLRLWQEVAVFSECLMLINHRSELREHDQSLARKVIDAIASLPDEAATEDAVPRALLLPLRGRDDVLDRLLALRGPLLAGQLRRALDRLTNP